MRRGAGLGIGLASLLAVPVASEVRIRRTARPVRQAWRRIPVEPHGATRLGISFRTPQVEAFGLEPRSTLGVLLDYPFDVVRLGAYWNRIEPAPGSFDPTELDRQLDAVDRAGKQVIVGVGALKTFGYPEFFAPPHVVQNLPEGTRIRAERYPALLDAATEFIARIVERYKAATCITAWQVEHEAVDPLGFEHSWRLDVGFVEREVQAARQADPSRPILMNGFLPQSLLARASQWWQTRDQGDSLAAAQRLADIVGIDFYPRLALTDLGGVGMYLDGMRSPWQLRRFDQVLAWAGRHQKRVMISEGQAEPWEAVTIPPNPVGQAAASCPPEALIDTYNHCVRRAKRVGLALDAYLFWGAEYWMLRQQAGDASYLHAFARILETS